MKYSERKREEKRRILYIRAATENKKKIYVSKRTCSNCEFSDFDEKFKSGVCLYDRRRTKNRQKVKRLERCNKHKFGESHSKRREIINLTKVMHKKTFEKPNKEDVYCPISGHLFVDYHLKNDAMILENMKKQFQNEDAPTPKT